MKRKLIWKGTLGEAMKHPIFNLALEEVEKIIESLNEEFRKDNVPQKLSGDEFNDLWEEKLKSKIKEELK